MNYTITFLADYKHILPLRDLVYQTALQEGFSKEKAEHLKSVVDELCANAIQHGSKEGNKIVLQVIGDKKTIKIICQDEGRGNKLKAKEIEKIIRRNVSLASKRGRGLSLIVKSFVDELTIRDQKGGGIIITTLLHNHS